MSNSVKLSHCSLAELQPVVACGHGQGRLARERCSQDVEPQGQTRWICRGRIEEDGRTARRPWWPSLGAGSGDGQEPLESQASRDRPRVWVAVGSRAGFPGGPAVSVFSGPWKVPLDPLSCGPSLHACRPLPAASAGLSSSSRACDRPHSLPLSRTEPASPHVGVARSGRGVPGGAVPPSPEKGGGAESLARVRAVGAAAMRWESVLPAGCGSGCVGGGGSEPREVGGGASPSSRVSRWTAPVLGGLWR